MRKITRDAINAFMSGRKFKRDNTQVTIFDVMYEDSKPTIGLYLHGNLIARREKDTGKIKISNAGWSTNTTKERLNGIPGVSIHQKAGQWYLNGVKWDGGWITI